ncbi:MAG: xanthine dehydrogenase small subunit [Planctomycetota bacterium]
MQSTISFIFDGKLTEISFPNPQGYTVTTTVLNYLRSLPHFKGTKEGCAEGDCGACTVVIGEAESNKIAYRAVDSCLIFLPMLHGKQLITVEQLATGALFGDLHPVQKAMVETNGSQCGFCTPGIMMSLFALYKNHHSPSREIIEDYLTGNLCRCTGYKPIIEAAEKSCVYNAVDSFSQEELKTFKRLESIPQYSLQLQTSQEKYFRPITLSEALDLKNQYPEALFMSGATDIALRVTKQHQVLPEIIDLSAITELKHVLETSEFLTLGAGLNLNQVSQLAEKHFSALTQMLSVFGSRQIRNLATLGGNLGTSSPIGDTPPVLIAYNATVWLESKKNGRREVKLDEFFKAYRETARQKDEILVSIQIPKISSSENVIVKSYKISKRKDLDISTVSGGFRLERNSQNQVTAIKLAYGGMAAMTKRASKTEDFLLGKKWCRPILIESFPLLDEDFTPISDVRGSAKMRSIGAKNLLLKFCLETQPSEMLSHS